MKKLLNFEYAAIHGFYWMYYGVICNFASVFLLDRSYSNSEIGIILATGNMIAIPLQGLIADIADRTRKITVSEICQMLTALLIVLTVFTFTISHKTTALSIVYIMLVGWVTALQPLLNSLNFRLQECQVHINFGVARSMGSLAYAVMCGFLGTLVENHGVKILPPTGESVLVFLMFSFICIKFHFKKINKNVKSSQRETHKETEKINLLEFAKKNKVFLVVNIGVLGVYFSNAVLNNYMVQIVSKVGGNSEDMGRILAVMAFLEIPTMFCFDWFRKKLSYQSMLKVAAICFTVKIGMCYVGKSVTMIFAAQFLQLFSFALFLPAMVHFTDKIMNKGEAVKGQTLFTVMVTAANVFASLVGGIILDMSGAGALTLISTIVTAIGAIIIIASVDKIDSSD